MVEVVFQSGAVEVSGVLPPWLLALLLLLVSVPLAVGWAVAARRLREASRWLMRQTRIWAREVLMRILTERDDRSR
ncbi:hypothetical protein [Streptomyces sp. NPDC000878]